MSEAWIARILKAVETSLQAILLAYLFSLEALVLIGDGLENTWLATIIMAEAVYGKRRK